MIPQTDIDAMTETPERQETGLLERIAVALWQEELGDSAPSIRKNRTLEHFRQQLPEVQDKFKRFARAALAQMESNDG